MNRRQLGLGAAAAALAAAAHAQDAGQLNTQPPLGGPRPMPTPPRDPAAIAFYEAFNRQIGNIDETLRADVQTFYEMNGWRPVWNRDRLRALNSVALRSERHAMRGQDYFDFVGLAADPPTAEIRTTAAAIRYARALSEGQVRPETVEELWEMQKNRVDLPRGLHDALQSERLLDWMEGLAPSDIGYTNLSAGYVRYRRLIAEGKAWPAFRSGPTIEPGSSDGRIPALVARLVAEGDLSQGQADMVTGNRYTPELVEAVKGFQVRHGLSSDGRIGTGTQRSLSASAEDRARQIALNLERRRWLKRDVAPERIEVNVAAAIMVYWKDGKPIHSNRVVVGTAENQTPSLEKPFASVVANPPWYVPAGIARREILPRGPGYLRSQNMYVTEQGTVVQRAGPQAALGYVKFELQDSYAIFLHDTPSKAAFNNAFRHRSHGCVRVQGAIDFARLLLSPDPTKLGEFDDALASKDTTRVTTGREIGVRLLYWTAFVDGQGRVAFREDVYKRDEKLADALGIAIDLPTPIDDGQTDADDVGP
ncbi:murein L,D-transpeptidase [Brevundimonas sp.]|uniref:L,D-transpeptidase family protein n=1 Tax=Brevundimonas sp. TaxID=1871086 RepID=UPI0035AD88BA